MFFKSAVAIAAVALAGTSSAQQGALTKSEANAVLNQVDAAISKTLGIKTVTALPTNAQGPASRTEIIVHLNTMFESYRPLFQYTPRPYTLKSQAINAANKDQKVRAILTKFVRFGCSGTVAPLVIGPGESMTVGDFAEAIGYYVAQISALTYLADPLWVPNIQRKREDGACSHLELSLFSTENKG